MNVALIVASLRALTRTVNTKGIGVCHDAERNPQVMGKEIVLFPNKDFPMQWQDQRSLAFIRARSNRYLLPEVTVVGQAMRVSFALLRVLLA